MRQLISIQPVTCRGARHEETSVSSMSRDTELSKYYHESSKQTEEAQPLLPEQVAPTPINFTLAVSFN